MPNATHPFLNRIALTFDFDGTLAPDTLDAILEHCGIEPDDFHHTYIDPYVEDGWDALIAVFYGYVQALRDYPELPQTKDELQEVARKLQPFDGVPEMFERVRKRSEELVQDIEVEFYLLTCGLVDVHRAMDVAEHFTDMWGSEFHFDNAGCPAFVRQIITHPQKRRYLLQLAKGLSPDGPNGPANVYRPVDPAHWHVPLDQMIYVGDGTSDMPAFRLMHESGGIALGVVDAERVEQWGGYDQMHSGREVQNLAPADYSEGSELMQSLMLSVESICQCIELRRLSQGE